MREVERRGRRAGAGARVTPRGNREMVSFRRRGSAFCPPPPAHPMCSVPCLGGRGRGLRRAAAGREYDLRSRRRTEGAGGFSHHIHRRIVYIGRTYASRAAPKPRYAGAGRVRPREGPAEERHGLVKFYSVCKGYALVEQARLDRENARRLGGRFATEAQGTTKQLWWRPAASPR